MSEDCPLIEDSTIDIESFESISIRVCEEETRLFRLKQQNLQKIPQKKKKQHCTLPVNKEAMKFFESDRNISMSFHSYVYERRDNQTSTQSVLQQCAQFVSYIKLTLKNEKSNTICELIFMVIDNNELLLHQYLQYLRELGIQPSTILLRINSIYHMIQWLKLTTTTHFTQLCQALDRLILERSRFHAITSINQKKKTLETLIEKRQWVEGGLPEVQALMRDSFTYFDSLVSLSTFQPLKSHQYSWCLGFTLASFWVFGLNARAKCIETMTRGDLQEIQEKEFHLSTNFKTSKTYGYQIVSVPDILKIYVKYIRRQRISEEIDSDEAPLFPTYSGTPLSNGEGNKKINSVFKRYGFDLSVTRLRDMLSTHIEDRFQDGKISSQGIHEFFHYVVL